MNKTFLRNLLNFQNNLKKVKKLKRKARSGKDIVMKTFGMLDERCPRDIAKTRFDQKLPDCFEKQREVSNERICIVSQLTEP
ncbi:CLUMA_CG004445, isoform A [Clunio marinus]|uniref:CLUMA_CG004445, isoform A n=1 Tax=Clunio marinus TaxID=568069 RepID=A0A1J1HX91_9DIPT|nr:CLUMA_CG004445, isoform A [Clunio marinus]